MSKNVLHRFAVAGVFCAFTVLAGCGGGGSSSSGSGGSSSSTDNPFSPPGGTIADTGGSAEVGDTVGSPQRGADSPSTDTDTPDVSTDQSGTLTLSWDANSEPSVNNYVVFYGKEPDTGTMVMLTETYAFGNAFDLDNPAVSYDTLAELKAQSGEDVCFRVKALDNVSQSDFSRAVCTTI